jgi:hypothetical protein
MEKQSEDQNSIQAHLYSLLIPEEILASFEIDSITEKEEDLFIYLTEKESCLPSTDVDLVQNGFMNPLELNSFPITGKRCFLKLKRRKWKLRGSDGSSSYTNSYDFTLEGTKATKLFGSFLKETGL